MRSVVISLVVMALSMTVQANDNMYTTCSTNSAVYQSSYWWYSYPGDASGLHLPSSEHYAVPADSSNTTMVYFNVCGSTDICQGAMACMMDHTGEPVIFAYPNSNPYYYSYNNQIQLNYGYDLGDHYYSFYMYLQCGSEQQFEVSYIDDDSVEIYGYSPEICNTAELSYQQPSEYTSLSGPIFMSGKIPMFSMDSVSLDSDDATFEGMFYYSASFQSVKINGTISNNLGESNQVSYYYDGSEAYDNPPIMVSEVYFPGQNQQSCVLLPNTLYDDDDKFTGWFSSETNAAYSGVRNYTSIYYNKGSEFTVNTWAPSQLQNQVYFTLMERTSDAKPVTFGFNLLAPFINSYDDATFVAEVDWENLSTTQLGASTFALPNSCYQ